jgi:hypothetical protein
VIRLTERDARLLRDLALSHVLSRDQTIALGYFGSVTRANTRLRGLCGLGLAKALDTPFFGQRLYAATPRAAEVVGDRLAPLAAARAGSPRFLRHALAVTNVRIALAARGATGWRFELQCRRAFRHGGRDWEVRPDGLALQNGAPVAVETDLGHVAPAKFREKLLGYAAFARSGECRLAWGHPDFTLLVVTTGPLRAARLARLLPDNPGFAFSCKPHDRLGIPFPGNWS